MREKLVYLATFALAGTATCSFGFLPFFQIASDVSPKEPGAVEFTVRANADWRGTVTIRDGDGRLVRILHYVPCETHKAGEEAVFAWDLADQTGQRVRPGEYALRVEAVKVAHENLPRNIYTFPPPCWLDGAEEAVWVTAHNNMFVPGQIGHFEESVIRKLDFDGYPMGDEIFLTGVNQCTGHNAGQGDIHDQIYVCGAPPRQDTFHPETLNRFDGKTGKRVWSLPLKTAEVGGTQVQSGSLGVVDTADEGMLQDVYNQYPPVVFDLASGTLLRVLPIDFEGVVLDMRRYLLKTSWDGGYFTIHGAKFAANGDFAWFSVGKDLNRNGTLVDGPVSPHFRERPDFGAGETATASEDIEGSVYFPTASRSPLVPRITETPDFPPANKGWSFRDAQGVGKVDRRGQLCLGAELPFGRLWDVSADGRLLVVLGSWNAANGCANPLLVHQADWDESRVRIDGGGKAVPIAIGLDEQTLFAERLAPEGDFRDDFNRARLLAALKQYERSNAFFEKAIFATKDPDYLRNAYLGIFRNNCRAEDYPKAVSALERLARAVPEETARARLKAAECHLEMKDFARAVDACSEALNKAGNSYWRDKARLCLGDAYRAAGDTEKARDTYGELARTAPLMTSVALLKTAALFEEEGKWEEAARVYEQVAAGYYDRRRWVIQEDLKKRCYEEHGVEPPAQYKYSSQDWRWLPVPLTYLKTIDVDPVLALGQKGFDYYGNVSGVSPRDPAVFCCPMGVAVVEGRLLVADFWQYEVAIYNRTADLQSGQPADVSLSVQPFQKFGLFFPVSIAEDGKRVYVSDYRCNRILIYNDIPTENQQLPDLVLGAPDLAACSEGPDAPTAANMRHPFGIHCDGKRLFAADRGNHRVLIWNALPTESNEPASVVLGQPNFESSGRNAGGLSARSLNRPGWVWSTGEKLVVSDTMNQRVLIWNRIPTEDFAPADVVLGQPDFTTCRGWNLLGTGSMSIREFSCPNGLFVDEKARLYLADSYNNRVLIWNAVPTENYLEPDHVLGRINTVLMGHVGYWDTGESAYYSPKGVEGMKGLFLVDVCADGKHVYISDYHASRVIAVPRAEVEQAMQGRDPRGR